MGNKIECDRNIKKGENEVIHGLAQNACKDLVRLEGQVLAQNISTNAESKEKMPEALKEAVLALTHTKVEVGKKFNGEPYFSSDFRDHPEFEKYFKVLERFWGADSKATPEQKKTFNIIKALKDKQDKAKKKFPEPSFFEKIFGSKNNPELEKSHEVVWKRVNGQDIFIMGVVHTNQYYRNHKTTFDTIFKNTGVLLLEPYSNRGKHISLALLKQYQHKSGNNNFLQTIFNQARTNPDISIGMIDPRNNSKVSVDNLSGYMPKIDMKLLRAQLAYLSKYFPNLVLDFALNSPKNLRKKLQDYSLSYDADPKISKAISTPAKNYYAYTSHSHGQKKALGHQFWTDNIMGINLHKVALLQRLNKFSKGPIVDIKGAAHVSEQVNAFENILQAYKNILQSPHFLHSADILKDETVLTHNNPDKKSLRSKNQKQQIKLAEVYNPENIEENLRQSIDPKAGKNIPDDMWEIPVILPNNPGKIIIFEGDGSSREEEIS